MSTFKLSRPSSSGGGDRENWPKAEHLDHLMLFAGIELRSQVETQYGPSDAAHVDYVVCVDCCRAWVDHLEFATVIVPALTGDPDAVAVVGRLGQSLAKQGRSPAWLLDDPTDADIAQVNEFLNRFGAELPSGKLVIDTAAIEAARPDPGDDPI